MSFYQPYVPSEVQSNGGMNGNEEIPQKSNNSFAPKPIHVTTKVETTRIGRSHSMFVMNPNQESKTTDEKNNSESEKQSEESVLSDEQKQSLDNSNLRKRMNVFKCPHTERKHYAKNMCNNCYHKQGRNKKATKCPHRDRQCYAKGKCQNCYLNDYHKVKRRMKREGSKSAIKDEQDTDRRISVETSSSEAGQELKLQNTIENHN